MSGQGLAVGAGFTSKFTCRQPELSSTALAGGIEKLTARQVMMNESRNIDLLPLTLEVPALPADGAAPIAVRG